MTYYNICYAIESYIITYRRWGSRYLGIFRYFYTLARAHCNGKELMGDIL